MRSLIIDDILRGGQNVSTEYHPGSFRAIGSKVIKAQRKWCYSFKTYGRPSVKREKISLSMLPLGVNRKGWQSLN